MSLGFRNEIDVTVWLAGATIADVAITPRSRPPLTRLFAGKPSESILPVLPRLFSLCSVAHQVAFVSAVEAAQQRQATRETARQRLTLVMAERLTELVRGMFVGMHTLDATSAAAVREVMQAATLLGNLDEAPSPEVRRDAVARINAALATLGIFGGDRAIAPANPCADSAAQDGGLRSQQMVEPSFLTAADDLDIVTRLLADGVAFSDAPDLQGRIPETGVWARSASREAAETSPAARLNARVAEIAQLCDWLERGDDDRNDVIASYQLGDRKGAAAVECARGRLYHAVALDDADRIVAFEFLAPTEWNFHARGPLVRSLKGAVLGDGPQGQDAVRALVGSFDPCVGFSLDFREASHA
ncbi:nickel-dependent hydrogenase large subunit [Rhodopseudomonas sp. B29]|uniref:nickel-dependent hydrogenase large subunit n=1 Tax=Rhodopseudomonas sp. B29 TaxID=95607 RepID=UPI00034DB655|nr:nickel-dependent hydrogenase large subunit [Rhodopseudomonas sp. B29]